MKTKKFLLLASILFFVFGSVFSQATICVDGSWAGSSPDGTPSKPYKTIQAAINIAPNGAIIKVAQGTYSEAVKIEQKKLQLLGGFSSVDFYTANPDVNKTTIKGTSAAPCILVKFIDTEIPGQLIISGFTIREGQRGIELSDGWPLGVLNNITIENNIIENNGLNTNREDGGGIGFGGKNVTIRNNVFRNNQTGGRGAAISRINDPVDFLIANNHIEKNTCYNDHGGGVYVTGIGTVTRNIFDGNRVAHPEDYGWGGAILVTNYDTTKVITLSHNLYRNNRAPSSGGAVFVDENAKVKMYNELLYNNTSSSDGSAIYVDACYNHNPSVLYMENCTVAGNSTDTPGGTAMYVGGSHAYVQNCIFWNNGSDILAEDVVEEIWENGQLKKRTVLSKAILKVNYTLTQHGFTGASTAGTGNIKSDPLFANAVAGDFHLKSINGRYHPASKLFVKDGVNSPAIDAGNPASPFSNEPQPNGGRVNMGCYGNTAEASKSGTVGMDEIRQIPWTVFPNPTKGQLRISNFEFRVDNVEIFDIVGKSVIQLFNYSALETIDISHLPAGIYFLKIDGKTVKIVKE